MIMKRLTTGSSNRSVIRTHPRLAALAGDERGQSVLEIALLMPVLCLLLLGIIEMGRYAEISILVSNAARAGVQYGAQNPATAADNTGIQTAALNDAQNGCQGSSTSNCLTVVPVANTPTMGYALCGCSGSTPTNGNCVNPPPPPLCPGSEWLVYVRVNTTGSFKPIFGYPGIPNPVTISSVAQMRVAQ